MVKRIIAGKEWSYVNCGQGEKTLLFFAGGLGESQPEDSIQELENEYRIISPSYPQLETVDEVLTGVREILRHEKREQVYLIGASIGGGLAQCFVRRYPEISLGLFLINTSVPVSMASFPIRILAVLLRWMPEKLLKAAMASKFKQLLKAPGADQQALNERFSKIMRKLTKRDLTSLFSLVADYHGQNFSPQDLKDWPGPITILESDSDGGVPAFAQKRTRRMYPQAQTLTFHKAGHSIPLSYRKEYFEILRKFLNPQA